MREVLKKEKSFFIILFEQKKNLYPEHMITT